MKIKIINIHIWLLVLYMMLKPLYILNDSPIQIADLILLFNIVFIIITKHKISILYPEKIFSVIILYQLVINIFSYFIYRGETLESFSLLKNNLYYIFNLLVMIYISTLIDFFGEKIIKGITKGLTLSMIIILIGLILNIGTSRNSSFFNNPNQLGYYSLIVITSTLLLQNFYNDFQKGICITIGILSILMCVSKAAIIAVIVLYTMYYSTRKRLRKSIKINVKKGFFALCLLILGIGLILKFKDILLPYTNVLFQRVEPLLKGESNLGSGRGYNRIKEIGLKIFYGVGEGAFYRFETMRGNETHSSYITIIISYGIIGFGMYILFFKEIIRKKYLEFFIIFSGVLVYWLSHNGLRTSLVWILFVIMYEIKIKRKGGRYEKKE